MEARQLNFFGLLAKQDEDLEYESLFDWSEEDIHELHEWLLVRTLESLAAAVRKDLIFEHLTWVNGYQDEPFSFYTCCCVSGYDYEVVRDKINQLYGVTAAS